MVSFSILRRFGPNRDAPHRQWKRNTVYAFLALGCGFLYIGSHSVRLQERPVAPKHSIPSSIWSGSVKPVDDKYKSDEYVE